MTISISIPKHTTGSSPRPHILYTIEVRTGFNAIQIKRRYSEFLLLHDILRDEFTLPPKHLLSTSLSSTRWVDDALIQERKAALVKYLSALVWSPEYQNHIALSKFLSPGIFTPYSLGREDKATTRSFAVTSSGVNNASEGTAPVVATYYLESSVDDAPPEMMDYRKFDIIFFGFAIPGASFTLTWTAKGSSILKRLVRTARLRNADTKIVLSIGGSDGSEGFSEACSTAVNRMALIDSIVGAVNSHGIDGVDIDWEYPNSKGVGIPSSAEDTVNFLKFLQSLRSALGPKKIISAIASHSTWLGADKKPLSDVSAFAECLDYINIANYGTWNVLPFVGPNAPLGNPLSLSSKAGIGAEFALGQWETAGFPANKILLGLPLCAYVAKSAKATLDSRINRLKPNDLKHVQGAHSIQPKVEPTQQITSWWGKPVPFNALVKAGILVKQFDGNYSQGNGFTMAWDDASSTPYLYNAEKETMITFDNTRSLSAKAKFALQRGMAGCFTWSLDQDDGTTLHDVIRGALGK